MREFTLWVFKVVALSLGIAGWVTYFILWFGVRIYGSMNLSFGVWGPSWIKWFETWIEPIFLIFIIAILAWAFFHELKTRAPSNYRLPRANVNDTALGEREQSRRDEEAKEVIPGIPRHQRLLPLFSPNAIKRIASSD